jgi:23S rRNA (adenine2503-C2)-methyltransferase
VTDARPELFGLTVRELAGLMGGIGRARNLWAAVRSGSDPHAPGVLGKRARTHLVERLRPAGAAVREVAEAPCGTRKLLVDLIAGGAVEVVVVPGRGRSTVCVSVQIGCARQCSFCVTATVARRRSLSAAEIVEQVVVAAAEVRRHRLPPLRNVVYMGMGEPLDNLDATRRSLEILTDPLALALAPRHVTVSTVGTSPEAIWRARDLPGCLAWSVHAVNDNLRRHLVPTTRHSMMDLRQAFLRVMKHRRATLFIEMALMADINDSEEQATELVDFLEPFQPEVRVNLLPLNPGRPGLRPSRPEQAARFQDVLRSRGTFCTVRRSRGLQANAACGQLAAGP